MNILVGSHNVERVHLYSHRFEMDQGRLRIWVDLSSSPDNLNEFHLQLVKILKKENIFSKVYNDGHKHGIDIPLKNTEGCENQLKKTIRVLESNGFVNSTLHNEVIKVWNAIKKTNYFNACTEGVSSPPPERLREHWQSLPFQPVPTAFQNVIFYNKLLAEKKDKIDPPTDQVYQELEQIARSHQFLQNDRNLFLLAAINAQNLTTPGLNRLTLVDHAFRSRNAALMRAMINTAANSLMDKRVNRVILNAVLREIEYRSTHCVENYLDTRTVNFCTLVSQKVVKAVGLDVDREELEAYIKNLVNAAIEVYAFVFAVLKPGSGHAFKKEEIWMHVEGALEAHGKRERRPSLFEHFEDDLDLRSTLNAFILDRAFKWIENKHPMMNFDRRVYEIHRALPSVSISLRAEAVVNDSSSELAKLIATMSSPASDGAPIQKINQLLGDKFTANHGAKWLYDLATQTYHIDFFFTVADKVDLDKKLREGKLKNYYFIPVTGKGFKLRVATPIQIGNDVWKTGINMLININTEAHQAVSSSTSSTSSTSYSVSNSPATMDGKALYSAASDNYRKALFIQAIEAYESLFKLQNSNLEEHELIKAHFECGAAHHSLNQLEEASHHYGIIIDHSLADLKIKAEALLNRAAIFTEQRNYAEALKDTEEAVKTGEAVGLDSDLLEIWREQISNLKVATPQPSVKNQATSSMITDQ